MSKPQWITAGIAFFMVLGLYAATQNEIFGPPKKKSVAGSGYHRGAAFY